MNYFYLFAIIVFFLPGCSERSDHEMRLTGQIEGLRKGNIYLQKMSDSSYVTVDSMVVHGNASFAFFDELDSPEVYHLALRFEDSSTVERRLPFFGEPGDLHLNTTLKGFERDAVVSGSINHDKWDSYKAMIKRYNEQDLELIKANLDALKEGRGRVSDSINAQRERLVKLKYLAAVNFAKNHNDFELAPYIMLSEVYDINVKYLDTIYQSLTPKIKASKYGKALESYINGLTSED